MNEALLKRRLIVGPVGGLMAVYSLVLLSDAAGWSGVVVPSVVVGAIVAVGLAWFIVRSERSEANRSRKDVRVGLIVVAAIGAALFLRFAPVVVIFGVCVLAQALALAMTFSAMCELKAGTYAEPRRGNDSGLVPSRPTMRRSTGQPRTGKWLMTGGRWRK